MNKKLMGAALAVVVPLVIAGGLVASSQINSAEKQVQAEAGYICPATGEDLPCPNCCPLKSVK